jgi:hypothetical protein
MKRKVRPELRGHPAIPDGIGDASNVKTGDLVRISAWGMGSAAHETTRQQRVAPFGTWIESGYGWQAPVAATGGDSGGPVASVSGKAIGSVKGKQCGMECGPTVASAIRLGQRLGLKLRLRLAGEPGPQPVTPSGQPDTTKPTPQRERPSSPPQPAPALSAKEPSGSPPSACIDSVRPTLRITAASARRTRLRLRGTVRDRGCTGRVARVEVAIRGRLFTARGSEPWTFTKRMRLRRGRTVVVVRAIDAAGNRTALRRTLRVSR